MTVYSGSKLPSFYIGSTSVEKIERGYHGTVTSREYGALWRAELKDNPSLFLTRIISVRHSRKEALFREEELQRKLDVVKNPLYINKAFANRGFVKVAPHTLETRAKISRSKYGKSNGPHSAETRAKQSAAAIGRTKSASHCLAMAAAQLGRKQSAETINQRCQKNTGQKRTPEQRARMSSAQSNKSVETRAKQSLAHTQLHSHIRYTVKAPDDTIYQVQSIDGFCLLLGAYSTSFLRTLKSGKPLQRGKHKGWQVLKKDVNVT